MADEIPPRVSALLERARHEDGPEPADRARVRTSLLAAIAAGKPPSLGEGGPAQAPAGESAASSVASTSSTASTSSAGALLSWGPWLLAGVVAGSLWLAEPFGERQPTHQAAAPRSTPHTQAHTQASTPAHGAERGTKQSSSAEQTADSADNALVTEARALLPAGISSPSEPAVETTQDARGVSAQGPVTARAQRAARDTQVKLAGATSTSTSTSTNMGTSTGAAPNALEPEPTPALPVQSDGRRELSLVQSATQALSRGELLHALSALDEHAAEFPKGVLAQEREGMRALTLCKLGRMAEGRRAAQGFLERAKHSPLSARVRAACKPAEGAQ